MQRSVCERKREQASTKSARARIVLRVRITFCEMMSSLDTFLVDVEGCVDAMIAMRATREMVLISMAGARCPTRWRSHGPACLSLSSGNAPREPFRLASLPALRSSSSRFPAGITNLVDQMLRRSCLRDEFRRSAISSHRPISTAVTEAAHQLCTGPTLLCRFMTLSVQARWFESAADLAQCPPPPHNPIVWGHCAWSVPFLKDSTQARKHQHR